MTCGALQHRTYDTIRLCWRSARKRRPCSARLAPLSVAVTVVSRLRRAWTILRIFPEEHRASKLGLGSWVSCVRYPTCSACHTEPFVFVRHWPVSCMHAQNIRIQAVQMRRALPVRGLGQTGVASNLCSGLGARRDFVRACACCAAFVRRALLQLFDSSETAASEYGAAFIALFDTVVQSAEDLWLKDDRIKERRILDF